MHRSINYFVTNETMQPTANQLFCYEQNDAAYCQPISLPNFSANTMGRCVDECYRLRKLSKVHFWLKQFSLMVANQIFRFVIVSIEWNAMEGKNVQNQFEIKIQSSLHWNLSKIFIFVLTIICCGRPP